MCVHSRFRVMKKDNTFAWWRSSVGLAAGLTSDLSMAAASQEVFRRFVQQVESKPTEMERNASVQQMAADAGLQAVRKEAMKNVDDVIDQTAAKFIMCCGRVLIFHSDLPLGAGLVVPGKARLRAVSFGRVTRSLACEFVLRVRQQFPDSNRWHPMGVDGWDLRLHL